jgi:hypothetical protein
MNFKNTEKKKIYFFKSLSYNYIKLIRHKFYNYLILKNKILVLKSVFKNLIIKII